MATVKSLSLTTLTVISLLNSRELDQRFPTVRHQLRLQSRPGIIKRSARHLFQVPRKQTVHEKMEVKIGG